MFEMLGILPSNVYMVVGLLMVMAYTLQCYRQQLSMDLFIGWVLCTSATWLSARWVVTYDQHGELVQLFSQPYVLMLVFAYVTKKSINLISALMFFSLFSVDLGKAVSRFGGESWMAVLWGIGGAGYFDALVIMPLCIVMLGIYHKTRYRHMYQHNSPTLI